MSETTYLEKKVYESSYTWKIKDFDEIWSAGYERLETDNVTIGGLNASWKLKILSDWNYYRLAIYNLNSTNLKIYYKFSVTAFGPKQETWCTEYQTANGKYENSAIIDIKPNEVADFLVDGNLTLQIKVYVETVELKKKKNSVKVKVENSINLSNVE